MYRNESFDELVSEKLKDAEFRQTYLLNLMDMQEDSLSLEEALKFTINSMGIVEFARLVDERKQNINDFLKGRRKPKRETLDKYLKPFGLKTVLTVERVKAKKVA